MTKENRDLLVNSIIVLLIGLLFVYVFAAFVPQTKEDDIFSKVVDLEETTLVYDGSLIEKKYIAKKGAKEVGTVYLVNIENGFGRMKLYVGIDQNDLISIEMLEINQSAWAIAGTYQFAKESFKNLTEEEVINLTITNVADVDAETNVSTSPLDIKTAVIEVIDFHFDRIPALSELELIFGEGATVEGDATFTPNETVLAKNIVSLDGDNVGFVYQIIGSGPAIDPTDEAKSITFEFALNNEGVLVGYIIDQDLYNHTWSYRRNVITFLDNLITAETNVADFEFTDIDAKTGSTNTTKVVIEMLEALNLVFEPALSQLEIIFEEGAEAVVDESFVATEEVVAKQNVLVNSVTVGSVYSISGTAVYRKDAEGNPTHTGSITIDIILDNNKNIKGYHIDQALYGHTNFGQWFESVNTYLELLTDVNLDDFELPAEVDSHTGATNTTNFINELLIALKGVA